MPQISRKVQIFRLEHSKKALYRIKAETLSLLGAGSRSLELVVDADQVLAQLLGDGGALLGHHGLLEPGDVQWLHLAGKLHRRGWGQLQCYGWL